MRNNTFKLLTACILIGLTLSPPVFSADSEKSLSESKALSFPDIKLKHWKASSQSEKLSFLAGFASMIELEREWQGKNPLSIEQSTVGSWVKGFADVRFSDISTALDQYAEQNPDQDEKISCWYWLNYIYSLN